MTKQAMNNVALVGEALENFSESELGLLHHCNPEIFDRIAELKNQLGEENLNGWDAEGLIMALHGQAKQGGIFADEETLAASILQEVGQDSWPRVFLILKSLDENVLRKMIEELKNFIGEGNKAVSYAD